MEGIKLYRSKGLFQKGEAPLSIDELVQSWALSLATLEKGEESDFSPFYLYLTLDEASIHHQIVEGGRERTYPVLPCLISQPGRLSYSSLDQTFRVSAFGPETIPWGFKWSFPQIYLDPITRDILKGAQSPNGVLLEKLRRWIRDETFPVAFLADEKKIQTPFRLGKHLENLKHPILNSRGIHVIA